MSEWHKRKSPSPFYGRDFNKAELIANRKGHLTLAQFRRYVGFDEDEKSAGIISALSMGCLILSGIIATTASLIACCPLLVGILLMLSWIGISYKSRLKVQYLLTDGHVLTVKAPFQLPLPAKKMRQLLTEIRATQWPNHSDQLYYEVTIDGKCLRFSKSQYIYLIEASLKSPSQLYHFYCFYTQEIYHILSFEPASLDSDYWFN